MGAGKPSWEAAAVLGMKRKGLTQGYGNVYIATPKVPTCRMG